MASLSIRSFAALCQWDEARAELLCMHTITSASLKEILGGNGAVNIQVKQTHDYNL